MSIRARASLALGLQACSPEVASAPDEPVAVAEAASEPAAVEAWRVQMSEPTMASEAVMEIEPPMLGPLVGDPEATERLLATVRCRETTAIFSGEDVRFIAEDDYDDETIFPVTYGVHRLAFRFDTGAHAGETIEFDHGGLFHSDWTLDIFSPDCRRVLLLQDRFGPYHVVPIDRLPDYLLGRAEPEAILTGCEGCSSAAVHGDGLWIDADTLEYVTAACGTSELHRVDLPGKSKCRESAGEI